MSNCLFCKIASHQIPSTIVYEDEELLAFRDIDPKAPTHVLIIPKKHVESTQDITAEDGAWWSRIPEAVKSIAAAENIDGRGYRLVVNCKSDGGQAVNHLHVHLLGGRKMSWPPG